MTAEQITPGNLFRKTWVRVLATLALFALLLLVALPYAASYAMHKWLANFAYRTGISPALFLFAGMLSLVIAALPVGYQALKAATSNPVDALRYE